MRFFQNPTYENEMARPHEANQVDKHGFINIPAKDSFYTFIIGHKVYI